MAIADEVISAIHMKCGMVTDRKYTFRLRIKYCVDDENEKHGDGSTLRAYVQQI